MSGPSTFLIALLTSAVTSVGAVYVVERTGIIPPRPPLTDVVIPDFHGLNEADARANAAASHIALLVAGREPNEAAKGGTVLRQSVPAGQRVAHDYAVNLVLAEEIPKVPAVTGLTVADATARLEQRGYTLQVGGTTPDPTVAAGLVVAQTPKADGARALGASVTVQVSGGPGDIELPKLLGMAVNKAKEDLEKLGAKPVIHWVAMAETPTFVVLSQKPAAHEKVKPGTEVQLTVCR